MRRSGDRAVGRVGGRRRGTVASTAPPDGFGFIEPDDAGGQLLVRAGNIEAARPLRPGDAVLYRVAAGTFCVEAIDVCRVAVLEQVSR